LFTTELTNQMRMALYPPLYAVFPKSEHAQNLIIASLYEDGYSTLHRMRGLLAVLTARLQETALLRDFRVDDKFSFLDLRKLLGFELLTVTDGDSFAH
tara:strand:- start:107 stop:400 length:294 start_codon:yes stop_codon:yes gene_type:complete